MLRYLLSARIELLVVVLTLGSACRSHAQQSIFDPEWNGGKGPDGVVHATLVQSNGKILIGGSFTNVSGHYSPFLARLNPDGSFDDSFAAVIDGTVNRLLQLPNGDILVAGEFAQLQGHTRRCLGMLGSDGTINTEFDATEAYAAGEAIYALAVQEDGKIVTGSKISPEAGQESSRLTRLGPLGGLDKGFNRTQLNSDVYVPLAILPLERGQLLVGGTFQVPGHGLVLVDEAGVVQKTFSEVMAPNSSVFVLQKLTNGNILIGGALVDQQTTRSFMLHQLTPEWKWSPDFAPVQGEKVPNSFVRTALVQLDGKIVFAGQFYYVQGYWRRHIARVDASGVVDPCFNPTFGLGGIYGAHALALQADKRIVAGGMFGVLRPGGINVNLTRLLPQTDCNITRVDGFRLDGGFSIYGNTPPGGTNYLQSSTDCVEWKDLSTNTEPYFVTEIYTNEPAAFFRIRRDP
jgi:uncharacterized delta-60 repeat protein